MKLLLYFFAGITLFSCTNNYQLEDEAYNCLKAKFKENGQNLEATLDTLEYLFIEFNLIESNSPDDLRDYYQKTIDSGYFLPLSYGDILNVKSDLSIKGISSFDCITEMKFNEGKLGKIQHFIDSTVEETGQITVFLVSQAHLKHLTAEDFKHPYYRAGVLLSLQGVFMQKYLDPKYKRLIPKKLD